MQIVLLITHWFRRASKTCSTAVIYSVWFFCARRSSSSFADTYRTYNVHVLACSYSPVAVISISPSWIVSGSKHEHESHLIHSDLQRAARAFCTRKRKKVVHLAKTPRAAQACRAQSENIITATVAVAGAGAGAGCRPGRGLVSHACTWIPDRAGRRPVPLHATVGLLVYSIVRASLQLGAKRLQAFFSETKGLTPRWIGTVQQSLTQDLPWLRERQLLPFQTLTYTDSLAHSRPFHYFLPSVLSLTSDDDTSLVQTRQQHEHGWTRPLHMDQRTARFNATISERNVVLTRKGEKWELI